MYCTYMYMPIHAVQHGFFPQGVKKNTFLSQVHIIIYVLKQPYRQPSDHGLAPPTGVQKIFFFLTWLQDVPFQLQAPLNAVQYNGRGL